jgi:hypothetical protein
MDLGASIGGIAGKADIGEAEAWASRNRRLVVVAMLGITIFGFSAGLLSSYTTAYEGAKAQFYGVQLSPGWSPEKQFYSLSKDPHLGELTFTNRQRYRASACSFDTSLQFDPDAAKEFMCNLRGYMTSVFIPLGSKTDIPPEWVPQEFWRDSASWSNPVDSWTWQVANKDNTTTVYRMEKWLTKWYVTLAADWDSGPSVWSGMDEAQDRRYCNAQVWVEFDISPVWYFDVVPANTYFAIAKVELANYKEGRVDDKGNFDATRFEDMSVSPGSPGGILTLYTQPFGAEQAPSESAFTAYTYQGTKLNPLYFRDKVYAHINLDNFGSSEYWDWASLIAKGDAVTFGFTVTQFVVGEWTVKDTDNVDWDKFGEDSKVSKTGWSFIGDFIKWVGNGLSNPLTWLGLAAFGFIVIIGLGALAMFWFAGMPRRRGGESS